MALRVRHEDAKYTASLSNSRLSLCDITIRGVGGEAACKGVRRGGLGYT